MGRLLKLSKGGFRGKVTINFDGSGPKDIIEQRHESLADLELDVETVEDVQEMWRRIKNL